MKESEINTEPWASDCPAQDQYYGDSNFFQGDDFSCRYNLTRRGPFRIIYIPYGPNFENLDGLKNFIKWINSFKLTKVKIDLYRIYKDEPEALSLIKSAGFKPTMYSQDAKTSIVTEQSFKPNSRAKRYIRSASKHHQPLNLSDGGGQEFKVIDRCYEIYKQSCQLKGYQLKRTKKYFYQLAEHGILSVVKDSKTEEINCFLLSDVRRVSTDKGIKKVAYLVFTAMTEEGRKLHLGFLATASQFEYIFNNKLADEADFMGFSEEKGKHSIFKTKFGNQIIDLAGSFERFKFL